MTTASTKSAVSGGASPIANGKDTSVLNVTLGRTMTGMASQISVASQPAGVQVASVLDNGNGNYQVSVASAKAGIYRVLVLVAGSPVGNATVNFIGGAVGSAVISSGAVQNFTGSGFMPGELVTVTVHSSPIQIAKLTADMNGQVKASFTIPAGFESGAHTVVFKGERSGSVSVPFKVSGIAVTTGGRVANDNGLAGWLGLWVMAVVAAGALIGRRRQQFAS